MLRVDANAQANISMARWEALQAKREKQRKVQLKREKQRKEEDREIIVNKQSIHLNELQYAKWKQSAHELVNIYTPHENIDSTQGYDHFSSMLTKAQSLVLDIFSFLKIKDFARSALYNHAWRQYSWDESSSDDRWKELLKIMQNQSLQIITQDDWISIFGAEKLSSFDINLDAPPLYLRYNIPVLIQWFDALPLLGDDSLTLFVMPGNLTGNKLAQLIDTTFVEGQKIKLGGLENWGNVTSGPCTFIGITNSVVRDKPKDSRKSFILAARGCEHMNVLEGMSLISLSYYVTGKLLYGTAAKASLLENHSRKTSFFTYCSLPASSELCVIGGFTLADGIQFPNIKTLQPDVIFLGEGGVIRRGSNKTRFSLL